MHGHLRGLSGAPGARLSHFGAVEGTPGAVWVHIATSQRVVDVGLRTILESGIAPFPIDTTGPEGGDPDVVLFDVILMGPGGDTERLDAWLKDSAATVIAINRTLRPELGAIARAHGVEWAIDLGIEDADLGQVIQEAVTGTLEDSTVAEEWDAGDYLGQAAGLSRRESQVLQLVVKGASNQEIAETLIISINSVKTYIRSSYRKIHATNRAQAAIWAIQHGFAPPDDTDDQTATWREARGGE
jgi:DNA-binding NarL/FixJ family response regulator